MDKVRAKKFLGQHFLVDLNIAEKIAGSLSGYRNYTKILEVGPGMGVLTKFLLDGPYDVSVIEIDKESVEYLNKHYPKLNNKIFSADFLKFDLSKEEFNNIGLIGNFPYNISSQIFFKVLENKDRIPEVVGMIQKEVAERIASKEGNKTYGILSVLLQAFYDIEYLFTVHEHVFKPAPKVKSAVIRLKRNNRERLPCNEKFFFTLVKQGFNNRRKTLRNALKPLNLPAEIQNHHFLDKRAEQLSVEDFIAFAKEIEEVKK
ncbi:MAG: 16S rRNA (adenine(1518)-N(6)/adenine(1519)-N(6))-dimethyltransferase RsmA [Cytophagaceae bacterium]